MPGVQPDRVGIAGFAAQVAANTKACSHPDDDAGRNGPADIPAVVTRIAGTR